MNDINYLIGHCMPGCSRDFLVFNPPVFCFCCHSTNTSVVNASRCSHTEFVKLYFKMEDSSKLWICSICHYMLKKIELFRLQVYNCFNNRKGKNLQSDNRKLINDLNKKRTISIISIVKNDQKNSVVKTLNSDANILKDPLEHLNKEDTEIKLEPKSESETDSAPEDFESHIETFTHIKKSSSKDTNTPKLITENKNPKTMVVITTMESQNKRNPMSMKMHQNLIPIKPKVVSIPNAKGTEDIPLDNKLEGSKANPSQNVGDKNIDKLLSYLHKPTNIMDSTYFGKITQEIITEEQLHKERDEERSKDYFKNAKYKCESCIKVFEYDYILDKHNDQHHIIRNSKQKPCEVCKCVYGPGTYKTHIKNHLDRFVCLVCNKKSIHLPKLAFHYNKTHVDKESIPISYWCDDCDFKTGDYLKYTYHRKRHREWKCNICNKKIYVKKHIHMKTVHSEVTKAPNKPVKTYKCEHCDSYFVNTFKLNKHIRVKHKKTEDTITTSLYCAKCDKVYKSKYSYQTHISESAAHVSNEQLAKFICDYCGAMKRYKKALEGHIEMEHLKTMRFTCKPCNKVYGSDFLLENHIKWVHKKITRKVKDKICQYCGLYFTSALLKTHILKHTGERPLKCDICEMTFAHKASLYTHRRLKHKIPRKRDLLALENEK